jgi:hypothetical protein
MAMHKPTEPRHQRGMQSKGLHVHSYSKKGPLATLLTNHFHDKIFIWSTISSVLGAPLLKIQSFLVFQTTHINAFQIKQSPTFSLLFFAQWIKIAKEEIILCGRIIVNPSHLVISYHTFAA